MNLRQLQLFIAVYEARNISLAAQKCFISQPALSNAIKQLEESLGVSLFKRSKKGATPTTDGEFLYSKACQLKQEVEQLQLSFQKGTQAPTFSLATMEEMAQSDILKVLHAIKSFDPNLRIHLCEHFDFEADARLTLSALKAPHEDFLKLWKEQYVLCMHKDQVLAQKEMIFLEDLHRQPFIECPPCEAHERTIKQITCKGLSAHVVATAKSKNQVLSLVRANIGISFLPENMVASSKEIVIKPFEQTLLYREVGLAYSQGRKSPLIAHIINAFEHAIC